MKIITFGLVLMFLFSCRTKVNKPIDTYNEIVFKKRIYDTVSYNKLFDSKLIGLSTQNESETDFFKKYWLDFNASCMWGAIDLYIDYKNDRLLLVRQSEEDQIEYTKEDNVLNTFQISNIRYSELGIVLELNDTLRNKHLVNIKKIHKDYFYKVTFDSILINGELGRYSIFTIKLNQNRLSSEGCGEFDG